MHNACLTGYFVWNSSFASAGYPHAEPGRDHGRSLRKEARSSTSHHQVLHVGSALLTLDQGMHKALFEQRIERAGDVADFSRLYFYQNSF